MARATIVDLSTSSPFKACQHFTYVIHPLLFNYLSLFLSTKLIETIKDKNEVEMEVYCWIDVIYPDLTPYGCTHFIYHFSFYLMVKLLGGRWGH